MVGNWVGKAGSAAARAEIRYLLWLGRTQEEICASIGVARDTLTRSIKRHGLTGDLSPEEAGRFALLHQLYRAERARLDGAATETAAERIEGRIAASAKALARLPKTRKREEDAMADDKPAPLRIEDMSDDELRAHLERVVLGLDVKAAGGDAKPRRQRKARPHPLPWDGPGLPKTPGR